MFLLACATPGLSLVSFLVDVVFLGLAGKSSGRKGDLSLPFSGVEIAVFFGDFFAEFCLDLLVELLFLFVELVCLCNLQTF